MKAIDVEIRGIYQARVSGRLVEVLIEEHDDAGGWWATNLRTSRLIRIRTASRLRPLRAETFPRPQEFYDAIRKELTDRVDAQIITALGAKT